MSRFLLGFVVLFSSLCLGAKPFPVLSPRTSEDFCDYLEYVFDVPLTLKQRDEAAQLVAELEKNQDHLAAEIVIDAVTARADLKNHTDAERAAFRGSVEDELIKILRLKYRNKPLAKWVLNTKNQLSVVLVDGKAPLTQQAAEAWVELVDFLKKESGLTSTPPEVPPSMEQLAGEFSRLNEDQQRVWSDLPRAWAALRKGWPAKNLDEKRLLKAAWKRAFTVETDGGPSQTEVNVGAILTLIPGWL